MPVALLRKGFAKQYILFVRFVILPRCLCLELAAKEKVCGCKSRRRQPSRPLPLQVVWPRLVACGKVVLAFDMWSRDIELEHQLLRLRVLNSVTILIWDPSGYP